MSHRSPTAGFLALAAVYAAAGVLAVVPTPWTKVGAAGLMAIPDAIVFGAGYSMGRDWGHFDFSGDGRNLTAATVRRRRTGAESTRVMNVPERSEGAAARL